MRIFLLWRMLNKVWSLMQIDSDRAKLSDLLTEDSKRWTLPVEYRLETRVIPTCHDDFQRGRISAFRQAAEFFDQETVKYRVESPSYRCIRRASVKMFALMEQEIEQ